MSVVQSEKEPKNVSVKKKAIMKEGIRDVVRAEERIRRKEKRSKKRVAVYTF